MVVVVVVVVVKSELSASPKNSSNLSLLTANTVPLSAHFPINVNASNVFFFFLGNKGDEGIDGKGECDDEVIVIILMMITTLVMFR